MLRRGFSSPGFDQGKQSEYDAAVEAGILALAGLRRHKDMTDGQFEAFVKHMRPVYQAEAMAVIDAIKSLSCR